MNGVSSNALTLRHNIYLHVNSCCIWLQEM
uniref:Uncharacterized protein n=1 Tax=Anguilla anguilla TaxID=7936 RepID=A0A0E9TIK4_ANGAN